jgi:hypothetical protein
MANKKSDYNIGGRVERGIMLALSVMNQGVK